MVTRNIEILKKRSEGVTFIEALKLADGKRLMSNIETDAILQDEEQRKKYADLFWCWTGSMIVYEKAGKPFGEYVKDSGTGWIIDVPKEFQGKVNGALLIEHPHFKVEKGAYDMTFIKPEKDKLVFIEDFPKENGWYLPDEMLGIPLGSKVESSDKNARYLYRRDGASLRPVSRGDDGFGIYRRDVFYYDSPDGDGLGVGVVEDKSETKPKAKKVSK